MGEMAEQGKTIHSQIQIYPTKSLSGQTILDFWMKFLLSVPIYYKTVTVDLSFILNMQYA